MIKAKLLGSKPPHMNIGHGDVIKSLERISEGLGYNFVDAGFLKPDGDDLFIVAPRGIFNPSQWSNLERVGTNREPADGPCGLALFFLFNMGLPFAEHHWDWAIHQYNCWNSGLGAIIEASRGFGKSIFMRASMAHQIGMYPDRANLVIRASDRMAIDTVEGIAGIMTGNPWQLSFPNVVPKLKPGQSGGAWSAHQGYCVVDITRPDDWASVEASRTSPTLFKFGYGSRLLGGRVTGCMLIDDIHDRSNALNTMQREELIELVVGDIMPMLWPGSRITIIGTPQGENDLLQRLPETPRFNKIRTPITKEGTYPGTPVWPEAFGEDRIREIYEEDISPSKIEFKKNRLLDLEAEIERHFTFTMFPHSKIENHWAIRMGVDYAAIDAGDSVKGRSAFAVLVTTQEPVSGAWIPCDGFVGHVTQSQADRIINDLYNKYGRKPRVEVICVEEIGSGKEFERILARNTPSMPLLGETGGGVPKEVRWENNLEPMLAGERILISDQDHPFLKSLVLALKSYPNVSKRGDPSADILDAMVWAHYHAFLTYGDPVRRRQKKEPTPNPYYSLSQMK